MRNRCQLARQAIAAGARHAASCEACAFFTTVIPQANCPCGHQTSCEHELGRAVATGAPFLGRFALVEPGYRDGAWRARDLETGADIVIDRAGPGQRTRCGALVVARVPTQSDSGSMVDGAEGDDVDVRLLELVGANAIADAVVLMQDRWGADLERVVRGRRPARLRVGADDICQMVWTSVNAALPAFRFEAPARAWLFRIARNKINDLVRRDRGVCRIFTIERHGNVRLVVMELVEGECLEDALPRLGPAQRLAIFRSVCAAVAEIHRAGVLHLDLKPRNIVLRTGDEPVVTDFGVAVLLGSDGHALPLGHTKKYAPPEQLVGRPVDARADVYALGITLRQLVPAGSAHIRGVIACATSDDPAQRHSDAAALLADLERPARQRRVLGRVAALVVALALAGGTVAFAVTRSHSPATPDVVINFDDEDTYSSRSHRAPALGVLARAGITAEMSPGTQLVAANTLEFSVGQSLVPSSAPNVLAHVGSNDPVYFTLKFARPVARVTFRRPALIPATASGITFPKWTAVAYAADTEVARDGEEAFGRFTHVPARDVVLEGACITSIRFESVNGLIQNGKYTPHAAFNAVVLDDLTLTYGGC